MRLVFGGEKGRERGEVDVEDEGRGEREGVGSGERESWIRGHVWHLKLMLGGRERECREKEIPRECRRREKERREGRESDMM